MMLTMDSGIGPREHLEEHGIEVVKDMPGVGSELVRTIHV
jgi:choline dehydrogenase